MRARAGRRAWTARHRGARCGRCGRWCGRRTTAAEALAAAAPEAHGHRRRGTKRRPVPSGRRRPRRRAPYKGRRLGSRRSHSTGRAPGCGGARPHPSDDNSSASDRGSAYSTVWMRGFVIPTAAAPATRAPGALTTAVRMCRPAAPRRRPAVASDRPAGVQPACEPRRPSILRREAGRNTGPDGATPEDRLDAAPSATSDAEGGHRPRDNPKPRRGGTVRDPGRSKNPRRIGAAGSRPRTEPNAGTTTMKRSLHDGRRAGTHECWPDPETHEWWPNGQNSCGCTEFGARSASTCTTMPHRKRNGQPPRSTHP